MTEAEANLRNTTVRVPSDGIITNLSVDIGHYAAAGAPIMTFISTKDIWVQADMRENSLGHIKQGNPVEIVLDSCFLSGICCTRKEENFFHFRNLGN